ncbi:MAG: AbrB/MazE/SpoVT family DNA-binding domain-containing protein [Methanomassiliicoccales archaeon]|jgi:bifunctional DNA-binding transcriptional regulator/antitoxin component of YhaV-PrlF toxin-antitoxin module|nr:AbrB/MazE/SpoVT family DNA-binding domain-containing protein [Methanomassiliicoccales archaeon]
MVLLTTVKITDKGRISLTKPVMEALRAKIGDHVVLYKDDQGRVYLAKVVPPEA